jgi:hypothetical protein
MTDPITELEEAQLFKHMVRHHDSAYYEGLFDTQLQFRALPIRTKDGGSVNAEYDNCVNSPPSDLMIDPDFPDRICLKGHYCSLSNRKWSCKYSIPKNPTNNRGYNPK